MKLSAIRQKFKSWRLRRPFWGATLSVMSGLVILYVPIKLYELSISPGNIILVGYLLGGLVLIFGVLSYTMPKLSTLLGILTIFASVLSIMGALGGLMVGTILGIVGGSMCIAWRPLMLEKNSTKQVMEQEIASSKEVVL